ncbi:MAG: CHAD domain containing protein [Actinobacteria bacterium 13_2_20CM_2_72_6]|nr:MAG: CHAD domain containing protein [Actinobacteria bacterium 13_2_20CM_2_72_6]
MLEEERKYEVDPRFAVPDLSGCLPDGGAIVAAPPAPLRATYYDTADRRLARAGVSLRFRRGDPLPWTVKLPTGVVGVRQEISRAGLPATIPAELVALVTAYTRGSALEPAAVLRTTRRVYELRDRAGRLLAELDDDTVAVLDGPKTRLKFREIEVERHDGGRKLLDRVDEALRTAGARNGGGFVPKHVRALGKLGPPELTPPAPALSRKACAGDVVIRALRTDIARMLSYDPLVRLREPLPDGDTAVHQMRVGIRRLRTDLRTFRPLLNPLWANELRIELSWLADRLGAARDAEVLRARLRRTAAADPLAALDDAAVARLDADLAARHEDALTALDAALDSARYRVLLDHLIAAAATPKVHPDRAAVPAPEILPRLVAKPWRQLAFGSDGVSGAGSLDALAPDDEWHAVRIRAKRARYATEAVADVLGGAAAELAKAVAAVQTLLGDHQDAAVAAQTWLAIAHADPDDHALAVTAGRLYERERTAVRRARDRFPAVWEKADRRRLTGWLP